MLKDHLEQKCKKVFTNLRLFSSYDFLHCCLMSAEFLICDEVKKANTAIRSIFSIFTSDYSFLSTFLFVWWRLVSLVIAATV
jgi:hypothetical protein